MKARGLLPSHEETTRSFEINEFETGKENCWREISACSVKTSLRRAGVVDSMQKAKVRALLSASKVHRHALPSLASHQFRTNQFTRCSLFVSPGDIATCQREFSLLLAPTIIHVSVLRSLRRVTDHFYPGDASPASKIRR